MAFETLGESIETLRERFGEHPEVPIRHQAIKLLASDTRLSILKALDARRMTVSELSRALQLNKSTVHEHLGKLVEGGLVRRDASEEREWVYYELTRTGRYLLRPSNARFVLMMGVAVLAGVLALAFVQVAVVAGQGLLVQSDATSVPAGESHTWDVQVTKPGLLALRDPAPRSALYLLDADQAARYQLTRQLPDGAHLLGPADGLSEPWPGHYRFTSALDPGAHYLLARSAAGSDGLLPLLADPVRVVPRISDVLVGVDPGGLDVGVRFHGQALPAGTVRAVDARGSEVAAAPVILGKATLPLSAPAGALSFEYRPEAPGSRFAPAQGEVQVVAPHVAVEPAEVAIAAPAKVRVVVDDPLQGPRADAPVSLERDGKVVARGATDASGASVLDVQVREPGPLVVKAGDRIVGTLDAKPGLRLWLEPGPHVEGQRIHVRSLLLGQEPQTVPGVSVLLNGREVGVTDRQGELQVQFGLGGHYVIEARKDGYVPQVQGEDVVPLTGTAPEFAGPVRIAGLHAAAPVLPGTPGLRVPALVAGQPAEVQVWVQNPDDLPRVVPVELRQDGTVVARSAVLLPAGGEAWVPLAYTPLPGPHALQGSTGAAVRVEARRG